MVSELDLRALRAVGRGFATDLRRVAFVFVLALPGLASAANPSAAERETARTYMTEGRKQRDENDLKAALRAFEAADAIMHVPTTGLEVAKTEAMLGQLVEGRDVALRVARSSSEPGEPTPFAEARAAARKLADDLEGRIPSIRVIVTHAPKDVTVSIDGTPVPPVAVGLGRKLDPGSHVVVAKAGSAQRSVNVQVVESETKDVPIDLSAPEPTQVAVTPPPPTEPPMHEEHAGPHRPPWTSIGIGTLAAGGVGIVLGAVTGAMSLSQTSTIQSQCAGSVCPPTLKDGSSTNDAISGARTLAAVSDVGFIVGGLFVAAGVVFVVMGGAHGSKSSIALEPGPGSLFLHGAF